MEILELIAYVLAGVVLMLIGNFIIDLFIPIHFPTEIKNGNKAVGWVSAGIYVGLGFIIRSAIISIIPVLEPYTLFEGMQSTILYGLLGIGLFILVYFLVDLVNKAYHFPEELEKGNEAIGIMLFGIFIGTALIVSGTIQ